MIMMKSANTFALLRFQVVPVMPKTPLDLMKTDDVDKADFPLLRWVANLNTIP